MSQTVKRISDADFTVSSSDNIIFTDDGGRSGNMSLSNSSITIYPENPGETVCLDFIDDEYQLAGGDPSRAIYSATLRIYDGADNTGNYIYQAMNAWRYTRTGRGVPTYIGPGTVCSSGGPLHIVFKRNSESGKGWQANVSTYPAPSESSCSISPTANGQSGNVNINSGDNVSLESNASLSSSTAFLVDFEDETNGNFITNFGGTTSVNYLTNCGNIVSSDNSKFAWFEVAGSGYNSLETPSLDLSDGGQISFDVVVPYDNSGGENGSCEGPSGGDQSLYFEYSTDNGSSWIMLTAITPTIYIDNRMWSDFDKGEDYFNLMRKLYFSVPDVAQTNNTKFRWGMKAVGGADGFGLDNIEVSSLSSSAVCVEWKDSNDIIVSTDPDFNLTNVTEDETYTASVVDCATNVVTCSNSVSVVVNDCNAGPDQTLNCEETSTTLAATSPATGQWTVVSGSGIFVNDTLADTVVNGLSEGDNVFQWSDGTNTCEATITVPDSPSPPSPENPERVECEKNPLQTLDANDYLNSTTGVTWYDAATGGSVVTNPTLNSVGTVTYYAEFSNGTCSSLTRTPVRLEILAAPNPPLSTDNITECEENPIQTLNANSALTATVDITWYDALTGGSVTTNPTLNSVGTVTYYAEFNNGTCSSLTRTPVTLTLVAAPDAGTDGILTVCQGTTPTIAELFAQLGGTPDTGGTWTNLGLV